MRDIARRLALLRRAAAAGAAAVATLTTVAALGAPSALAAGSVKVTSSFEQSPISLNTSDSIGFAIANSTGATLTNFSFTDTLPTGVTLDDPIGLTNTAGSATSCGTTTSVNPSSGATSAAGDSAVTITVASVPSATSGTICTISLGIVANTASVNDAPYQDVLAPPAATASPKPTLTPASLVVLTNPVPTLTTPTNNQNFKLGQVFDANFSCAATDPLDAVDSLFAADDVGNQVAPGGAIDTVDPGSHTLQVNCYSAAGGGDITSDVIKYKVSSYTLTSVKTNTKNGQVSFKSAVPAGKFVAELLDGKKVIGKTTSTVKSRKTATVTIKQTSAGTKLLKKANGKAIKVKLDVSFTPKPVGAAGATIAASAPIVVTKSIKVEIAATKKKAATP